MRQRIYPPAMFLGTFLATAFVLRALFPQLSVYIIIAVSVATATVMVAGLSSSRLPWLR
jgi:hypothetical protein